MHTTARCLAGKTRHTAGSTLLCRSYATVANDGTKQQRLTWPILASTSAIPTPYQIFNQKKGAPYSKSRFYELVKLYHPDRHNYSHHDSLSYTIRLERYRLVVAANEILSDPIKRGAYDCYGAGWNGSPEVVKRRNSSSNREAGWGSGGPFGPSQNATWEDWERWYNRNDTKQQPLYVSNGVFVVVVVVLATIGVFGQATHVGNYTTAFLEQSEILHEDMSKTLMRRRRDTATFIGNRDERIHQFLGHRESHAYNDIDSYSATQRKRLLGPEPRSFGDNKNTKVDGDRHDSTRRIDERPSSS